MVYILGFSTLLLVILSIYLGLKYREIRTTYKPILDVVEEAKKLKIEASNEINKLLKESKILSADIKSKREEWEVEYNTLMTELKNLSEKVDQVRDLAEMQSFGIYEPVFNFDDSEQYKLKIYEIIDLQKTMVKNKVAATCSTEWVVSGSKKEGQMMTNRQLKLMLRAFNGECDTAIAKVNFSNVKALGERINKTYEAINELGRINHCSLSHEYLKLKIQELNASYEYAVKKQNEKEEQAKIRDAMREEEKARKEIETAQKEAEEEEKNFEKALKRAREELEKEVESKDNERIEALQKKISILENNLTHAGEKKIKAIARGRLTKSGHVYVISNIGSFGENVYKVGMTRRLDPLDRVNELGDTSVPFKFDVHAMMYTEDAPELEKKIHAQLSSYEINLVRKREFFKTSLDDIEQAVREFDQKVEFIKTAVAEEYRESKMIREKKETELSTTKKKEEANEVEKAKEKFAALKANWKANDYTK